MRRYAFVGVCLTLTALFTALGFWQVERRAWKLDLIGKVEARVHAAPSPLPPPSQWGGDLAYRRVRVTGRFLHDHETLVQAVTVHGPGWWVMTPMRLSDPAPAFRRATGHPLILVNRGFVPNERHDPATRRLALPAERVSLTGLIRGSEPGGAFLRSNDPAADRWFSRDVAAIARARNLGPIVPFFLDADATANPGGYPIGGLTVIAFRNNHLSYAITWFGLALLSLAGAAMVIRSGARRR
ncbi:SURF1 family protein [Sphingomonas mucosissima]|uniref:SURF1-like protein n=1 Tax=Sphingomonas mucosissima TaxID=370959 RepID=A0A245ZMD0_9SPHN|nr:SURF1 family protein [Sphingomonas mucosissima]OWK30900.1 SURF1 family protein [Sphingomonas mucosissima]